MTNKKPNILIVDDNPENLKFLGILLADNGYMIAMAQDGLQALEYTKKNKPDLILLDIMMPGMGGFEACAKLKAEVTTKHIPVIFLTAKSDTDAIVKGFECGGVDYVTKPFNSSELLARVKTHIEIKILRGLIPICSRCKNLRDDDGMWKQIEVYIENYSDSSFSHSICPKCMEELYGDQEWYKKKKKKRD